MLLYGIQGSQFQEEGYIVRYEHVFDEAYYERVAEEDTRLNHVKMKKVSHILFHFFFVDFYHFYKKFQHIHFYFSINNF